MSFFQDLWNGLADGFGNMGNGLRHITTGYQPDKYPQDKAAVDELNKVSKSIDEKGFVGSMIDGTPLGAIKDQMDWVIIGIFGLLFFSVIFKD